MVVVSSLLVSFSSVGTTDKNSAEHSSTRPPETLHEQGRLLGRAPRSGSCSSLNSAGLGRAHDVMV